MTVPNSKNTTVARIFERQWLHVAGLVVLLSICAWIVQWPQMYAGQAWDIGSYGWFWAAILVAVAHQVYVWLCWRLELHDQALTRFLGKNAFVTFAAGFAFIGVLRVLAVFILAYSNRGSLGDEALFLKVAALIALVPALYLFYSVRRYFTFKRAFGIDHFDPSMRRVPFVRNGIFRFTPNGMYVYGFLLLWVPGLWWASAAALVVALFNHLYILVHYFATELPDIRRMYAQEVIE